MTETILKKIVRLKFLNMKLNHLTMKQVCKVCRKYHATVKSRKLHNTLCKDVTAKPKKARKQRKKAVIADTSSSDDSDLDDAQHPDDDSSDDNYDDSGVDNHLRPTYSTSAGMDIEVILDLPEWLKTPWIEESD